MRLVVVAVSDDVPAGAYGPTAVLVAGPTHGAADLTVIRDLTEAGNDHAADAWAEIADELWDAADRALLATGGR